MAAMKRLHVLHHSADYTLRKHAYSNIMKFLPPKTENFQMKNSDNFHISAQNIDCGYSLEVGFKGVKIIKTCFRDVLFLFRSFNPF